MEENSSRLPTRSPIPKFFQQLLKAHLRRGEATLSGALPYRSLALALRTCPRPCRSPWCSTALCAMPFLHLRAASLCSEVVPHCLEPPAQEGNDQLQAAHARPVATMGAEEGDGRWWGCVRIGAASAKP